MKELKLEELTARQKLGMAYTAYINGWNVTKEDTDFIIDLIRNHSLGAVWIQAGLAYAEEMMAKVKEAADYPILIMTDAEGGIDGCFVGKHNAIGTTGSEKHAYAFGKVVGVKARKLGYNTVCDPVVDMNDGGVRSLGTDKEMVSKLAVAEAKGMHDGGVLTICKHYPGGSNPNKIDSHTAESVSPDTKEELINYSIYPYRKLMEQNLMDGLMVQHKRFTNIDPNRPATLSKPVINIIRELGFDGFAITDALCMMGIRAKYNDVDAKGFAIEAGIDTILPYTVRNIEKFNEFCEAYDKGLIPDDRLDEAARRILDAQHKVTLLPKDSEISDDEMDTFNRINKDGVYRMVDDGVLPTISRDGKHYFCVMIRNEFQVKDGKVEVDTFSNGWHCPDKIEAKIKELFPNSVVDFIKEFPTQEEMFHTLENSLGFEEVVFMSFTEALAYTGPEQLTHRFKNLVDAMQKTDRISTLIHFGNPHVVEVLPHIPRVIFGGQSEGSVETTIEVLAGVYPANGIPTYEFKLK